jgi:trehalose-6-phosphate synthase
MPEAEQIKRMQWMRNAVREHNIFRWAANLLSDLTEIRIETTERGEVRQPQ